MRRSWETHAKDGWYVGPALDQYRCFRFWIPSTQGFCISQTAKFFHLTVECPMKSSRMKHYEQQKNLVEALNKNDSLSVTLTTSQIIYLKTLVKIFHQATQSPRVEKITPPRVKNMPPLRVDIPTPPRITESTGATSPLHITNLQLTHSMITRANNPIIYWP